MNCRYIARHDEEMEKIVESKQGKKNRCHTSREDVIRMTKEREMEEYNGAGIGTFVVFFSHACTEKFGFSSPKRGRKMSNFQSWAKNSSHGRN